MIAPVAQLKKAEIIWLANNRCRHGHAYLSHFNCFLEEKAVERPDEMDLKYGFLDIESTGSFKAQWGHIMSWCIKDEGEDGEIHYDVIRRSEAINPNVLDKRVVKSLVNKMKDYDVIVTYYGTRFDIPFIRTRALMQGIKDPLAYGDNIHFDLYFTVRRKFSLQGNGLDNACKALLGDSNKTKIDHEWWLKARLGDKEALEYVLEHNKMDVVDTERLYNVVVPYRRRVDASV